MTSLLCVCAIRPSQSYQASLSLDTPNLFTRISRKSVASLSTSPSEGRLSFTSVIMSCAILFKSTLYAIFKSPCMVRNADGIRTRSARGDLSWNSSTTRKRNPCLVDSVAAGMRHSHRCIRYVLWLPLPPASTGLSGHLASCQPPFRRVGTVPSSEFTARTSPCFGRQMSS